MTQLTKIARKSKIEEESEDVQEEASQLGKVLAKRKKGKATKEDIEEEKEDIEEEQDELGEALTKKRMQKKAWARIKKLPEHATIGPDYNQRALWRIIRNLG